MEESKEEKWEMERMGEEQKLGRLRATVKLALECKTSAQ